jgi:regulator of protease activity HflC (stomatin/prohibitin superfamily)
METAFTWLSQIFEAILKFILRVLIVRATHAGVKWRHGCDVKPLMPGLHVYWPLVTEIEIIVAARQTINLSSQVLTTKDNKKVVVGTVVVYKIRDIVQAIGKINWDVDTTIHDITQAAVVSVIAKHTLQELLDMIPPDQLNDLLTIATRKELRQFGVFVSRCKLTDFADCKVFKLVTNDSNQRSMLSTIAQNTN